MWHVHVQLLQHSPGSRGVEWGFMRGLRAQGPAVRTRDTARTPMSADYEPIHNPER